MLDEAFATVEVRSVVAHTLAEANASTRVLERAGFSFDAVTEDDGQEVWRWRLDRAEPSAVTSQ